eukprot:5377730-Pleurochrysis_carterae.AAC.2
MTRAASARSSPAGRKPTNASMPTSPSRARTGSGAPSGGLCADLRSPTTRPLPLFASSNVSVRGVPGVASCALAASRSDISMLISADRGDSIDPPPLAFPIGDDRGDRRSAGRCGDAATGSAQACARSARAARVPLAPVLTGMRSLARRALAPCIAPPPPLPCPARPGRRAARTRTRAPPPPGALPAAPTACPPPPQHPRSRSLLPPPRVLPAQPPLRRRRLPRGRTQI